MKSKQKPKNKTNGGSRSLDGVDMPCGCRLGWSNSPTRQREDFALLQPCKSHVPAQIEEMPGVWGLRGPLALLARHIGAHKLRENND